MLFIARDIDFPLLARDRDAVSAWIAASETIHIMRGHPSHSMRTVLAGAWLWSGPRRGGVSGIAEAVYDRIETQISMLHRMWRSVPKTDILQHDSYSCVKYGARAFPTKRDVK